MFCTKCATEIKDESANFCQNCAASVVRDDVQPTQKSSEITTDAPEESKSEPADVAESVEFNEIRATKKWNPIKRYGLLVVVLLIIAIFGLVSVSNRNSSSSAGSAMTTSQGCIALQSKISQSSGFMERGELLKLASEKGCNMNVQPAPTKGTATFSLTPTITWYPKGYREYTDGLAWKWTDESCGYSSGYCWTLRVKTRNGCADGIYAEANIEQKGVVIGYTNDTLGSLRPGATAKLEFTHFGGSGTLSASLTQLTCHNYSL